MVARRTDEKFAGPWVEERGFVPAPEHTDSSYTEQMEANSAPRNKASATDYLAVDLELVGNDFSSPPAQFDGQARPLLLVY